MTDDREGILGNLPRSRPGVRSDKRKRAASAPRQPAPKPPPAPSQPRSSGGGDAIEIAVRAASQAAETGIKVAARVAGGVLRRLPRP